MWVRTAAIRPVPEHALIEASVITGIEFWLGKSEEEAEARLSRAYDNFEAEQPTLSLSLARELSKHRDEVAMALGYFLTVIVFQAFHDSFGERLQNVDELAIESVKEAFTLDEQLRELDKVEALDSDDIVKMQQPHLVAFVHDHIEAALEVHGGEVDVDDIYSVYRTVLVELLVLSYAVVPPNGSSIEESTEVYA